MRNVYEVYVPVSYCEVYRVEASSADEAERLVEKHAATGDAGVECIGGVATCKRGAHLVSGLEVTPTPAGGDE